MLKRTAFAVALCTLAFVCAGWLLRSSREMAGPGTYPIEHGDAKYVASFPEPPQKVNQDAEHSLFLAQDGDASFGVSVFSFDPPLSRDELAEFQNREQAIAAAKQLTDEGEDASVLLAAQDTLLGNQGWVVDISLDGGSRRARVLVTGDRDSGVALAYVSDSESFSGADWKKFQESLRRAGGEA